MRVCVPLAFLCFAAIGSAQPAPSAAPPKISWRVIQSGVDFATIDVGTTPSGERATLYVVRITPSTARVTVALASEANSGPRTAAQWCSTMRLAVAINAGMFQSDGRSNVGYLRHGQHLNNPRWNGYQSVVAIDPATGSLPPLTWVDRDSGGATQDLSPYNVVVQNLRLISKRRKNVWAQSPRRWSEAAVATDSRDRLLFLFVRASYTMHDFNEMLLKLPLDIAGAMHVEGGPEASLSIHVQGVNLDLAGSYETGFTENDSNHVQWPIPNVIGVVRAK